jgi:sterol desaturase/sphingolipid hydroxylase (fatty acid hydroxylase superfamily)
MGIVSLEHSPAAYRADFVLYLCAITGLTLFLVTGHPPGTALALGLWALGGLLSWPLIEYLLHRFVLHGLQPFCGWHAQHHARPNALMGAPTVLTSSLILTLVFLPALWSTGLWRACALTLGVVSGYTGYAITHHATHHWRGHSAWLKQRKRWHALHHRPVAQPGRYGVTSGFWDHVFRTAEPAAHTTQQ